MSPLSSISLFSITRSIIFDFLIWTVHRTHMRRVVAACERDRFYRHNSALLRTSHPATCRGCLLLLCWPCCSCWRRPPLASRQLELLLAAVRSICERNARRSEVQKDMLAGAKGMSMHTSALWVCEACEGAGLRLSLHGPCTGLEAKACQGPAQRQRGRPFAQLPWLLEMIPSLAAFQGPGRLWPATRESWQL